MSMQASTVRRLGSRQFSPRPRLWLWPKRSTPTSMPSNWKLTVPVFNSRLGGLDDRIDGVEKRLGRVDERLDGIDKRLDGIDERLVGFDAQFREMRTDVKLQISESENRLFTKVAAMGLSATAIIVTRPFSSW